jgi:uncharacterized YigZ family protein
VQEILKDYYTVQGYGEAELEIQKSRFIAYVNRVEHEDEAIAFLTQIKKRHWNATHNCFAYIAGELDQYQKADDDGEPSGTAGKPILEVIKKRQLKDTMIVVTRYFGGIKLGAGGLIRAYGKSAALGLSAAGMIVRQLHTQVLAELDYGLLGVVENQLRNGGYIIEDKHFAEKLTLVVLSEAGKEDELETKLLDLTSGQVKLGRERHVYVDAVISQEES